MIEVARGVSIREDGLRKSFLRASGPGGQNVKTFCTTAKCLNPSFQASPALLG